MNAPVSPLATLAAILAPAQRTRLRVCAGLPVSDRTPITVVPGAAAPRLTGGSYYWTTPSGKTRVLHPMAYKWRTVYHPSTHAIEVGVEWLVSALAA